MGRGRLGEVDRISPSADRQQDLQMPMPLFQEEQLLDAAIDVVSRVVPRITGIMLGEA